MKKYGFLGLVVSLYLVSTPLMHSQNEQVYYLPFVMDFSKLSYYLQLESFRKEEVSKINTFFVDQQTLLLTDNLSQERLQKKFGNVLYGNLKLMKKALSEEQYKKYLRLINETNYYRMLADDDNTFDVAFLHFDPLPLSKEAQYIQDVLTRNSDKQPLSIEQWIAANKELSALFPEEEPDYLLFSIDLSSKYNDTGLLVQAGTK